MASGILNVGITGLNAAQMGFQTTSHNISNASTDGYTRQSIVQTTNTPIGTGSGFLGQGTNVQTVQRVYSQYLSSQVLSAQTTASQMNSYLDQINLIDNMVGDSSAGLTSALASFFSGVQEATANPSSISSRQSMISGAASLVSQFNSMDQRLTEIRSGINTQITSQVTSINAYAQKIADINQNIILANASGSGQPPNDLLDQREQILGELNKIIRVQTVTQSDGSYSVFIGNGQPLVVGDQTSKLLALASPSDPERTTLAMSTSNTGNPIFIPESLVSGGTLGGLISFRSETLDSVQNGIGRIALTLAQNFNSQQALGMDLNGDLGTKFFNMANTVAAPLASTLNAGNGAPSLQISNYSQLTTSDYRLTYTGSTYMLTRLSDNTVTDVGAGPTLKTVDGLTLNVGTGSPIANDNWLIQPTRNAAKNLAMSITDPRSVALASPIKTKASLNNTGTGTIDAGTVVSLNSTAEATTAFATKGALTPPVNINFTSTSTYDVYDNNNNLLASGVPYTAGSDVFPIPEAYLTTPSAAGNGLDYGYRIKISGAPATGDSFSVGYNSSGTSDNRNGVLLGALQTANTMESTASSPSGTASYQTAYSQLVSYVGTKTNEVTVLGTAQQKLTDQATTAVQALSGVNLDEEAANLLRYQQAYQAASKVISIASKLFDDILALGN